MKNNNRINRKRYISKLYCEICILSITQLAIEQHNESNYGAYFWLTQNEDNDYTIICHKGEKLIKEKITNNEEDIEMLEESLKKIGYEVTKANNNSKLITINRENIIKLEKMLKDNDYEIIKDKNNNILIPKKNR